jgi:exosome complex RNA-binding protein Rrp4
MVSKSVVLPGDFITASTVSAATNRERMVGAGLAKREDGIYATVAGVLKERSDKLWISSSGKRWRWC